MSEQFNADLQDFELPETESEVTVDINNNDIHIQDKVHHKNDTLSRDENESSSLPLSSTLILPPQLESKTEEQEEEKEEDDNEETLPETNELVVDDIIQETEQIHEEGKDEEQETLEETDFIVEDGQQEENFEDEETLMERWNSLKKKTIEMKNVALACPTFLHPEYKVIEQLDDIYNFMESKDNIETSDFQDVDARMQHVNDLVGRAIDNYLGSSGGPQTESKSVCKHLYGIFKTLAVFVVIAVFAFVVDNILRNTMMFMEDELLIGETVEASVEVTSEPLYCICQEPWDKHNRKFMIECNHCRDWFHGSCIGLQEHESHDIEKYHCPKCVPVAGPSQNKFVLNYHRHDYADKDSKGKPMQAGTQVFIQKLKEKIFSSSDDVVLKMRGNTLTLPYLTKMGFNRPILVENTDGLDLRVPRDTFSVRDVEKYVGSDRILDVIDVQRQTDIKMTMKEFADYYCLPNRSKLYNLISLEFSKTQLSRLVEAPYIARRLDWVVTCWPKGLDEEVAQRPDVQKYCLISTKDSYTDFHIDFGGTSVWYHILSGEKIFYLIEPTEENLALYAKWMASVDQYESFFADSVDKCYKLCLKKGQTLFIPTGWIHAVLTPVDSLVFGGNFLHYLNMDLQLKVYEIEKRLNVPEKYLFPAFEATHWFAVDSIVNQLQVLNKSPHVPLHILTGSKSLLRHLKLWSSEQLIAGPTSVEKYRREFIPPNISVMRLIKELTKEIRIAEKRLIGLPSLKAEEKPLGIKTCGIVKKQNGTERIESENSEKGTIITDSKQLYSSMNVPSKEEKMFEPIDKSERKKSKHSHHRHHHRHRHHHHKSSKDSGSESSKITPIKLKISVGSASSSPHYISSPHHASSVSPAYSTSTCSSITSSSIHQFPLNSNTKLVSLNETSSSPFLSPKHNGEEDGFKTDGSSSKDHLPKLRLSLSSSGERVKINDSDIQDSDNLYIDSDHDNLKIDTDEEQEQKQRSMSNNNKQSHSHSKSKKHRKSKNKKNERNMTIDDVLAGTLDNINELFKSSKYNERIDAYTKNSSPMVKESFQEMLAMDGKKGKKRKFNSSQSDVFDSIEKVHQDDDFIYLPLTADDDERDSKRSKSKLDDDEVWTPRAKVGIVRERDRNPKRQAAKREHVEKGLEKAAAKLASLPQKSQKRKYKTQKKANLVSSEKSSGTKKSTPPTSRLHPLEPLVSSKNISSVSKLPGNKPPAKPASYRFFDSSGKVKVLKSKLGIRDVIKRFTR